MQARLVLTGGAVVLAVAALAAGVALAGPGGGSRAAVTVAARSGSAHPGSAHPGRAPSGSDRSAASPPGAAASGWRVRPVAPLSPRAASIVVSPGRHAAFELVAAHQGGEAPFRLHRISLTGGAARTGRQFPVPQLGMAGGYLWVTGSVVRGRHDQSGRAVLYQVSPATLQVVRSWRLTGWEKPVPGTAPVTAGPHGSVWVSYGQHLRRISPRTGAVLSRIRLKSGLLLSVAAGDPSGRHLYVASGTGRGGAVVSEYAGGSGRLLASQAGSPLRDSAGGAALTAVPRGVWASFRTGMLGETVLLRRPGLRVVALPAQGPADLRVDHVGQHEVRQRLAVAEPEHHRPHRVHRPGHRPGALVRRAPAAEQRRPAAGRRRRRAGRLRDGPVRAGGHQRPAHLLAVSRGRPGHAVPAAGPAAAAARQRAQFCWKSLVSQIFWCS